MSDRECMAGLGSSESCRVVRIERRDRVGPEVRIRLEPDDGRPVVCNGCGAVVEAVHEIERRVIRNLPVLLDAETRLDVARRRIAYPSCGAKLERLPWLGRDPRAP